MTTKEIFTVAILYLSEFGWARWRAIGDTMQKSLSVDTAGFGLPL